MLNIAHLSDLHLGYSQGRKKTSESGYNIRENDGYVAYSRVIDQIIDSDIDVVLIAGDMFHSPRPKNHTIQIAQEGLRKLSAAGMDIYIIAGNHDATDIKAEVPSSKLLHEPNSNIYSYSEPYVVREIHEGVYMHFISHHAFIDQEETMSEVKLIDGAINILATHGSVFDTNMNMILRTPNEPREVVIPEYIMEMPWDYTFMGHIHERGWVSSEDGKTDTAGRKQFYNGSLVRRGFADKISLLGRGWTKWTVNTETSEITPEFFSIPERPQFDMEPIEVGEKTPQEVEKEILHQLKSIDRYIEEQYGGWSQETWPIVRQTIVGVNAITRLSINLERFNEYTDRYLVHGFKVVPSMDKVDITQTVSAETLNSGDIVTVFKEWNKANIDVLSIDEDIKEHALDEAEAYLKLSRDELLTKD